MPPPTDADDDPLTHGWSTQAHEASDVTEGEVKNKKLRKFDVVGDVAILNTMPPGTPEEREQIGKQIMAQNKAIRVS
jgi:tRNA G37 N-methylase Trm5